MSAAKRTLAEEQARRSLAEQGVREISDPIDEMWRLCEEAVAFKDFCAAHVARLEDRLRFVDAKGAEQLRSEVVLYERAMDRAERFLGNWARLGMEERLVRVREAQASALGKCLDRTMDAIGLPAEWRERLRVELAAQLRRLVAE
jgi:hypothetical protein